MQALVPLPSTCLQCMLPAVPPAPTQPLNATHTGHVCTASEVQWHAVIVRRSPCRTLSNQPNKLLWPQCQPVVKGVCRRRAAAQRPALDLCGAGHHLRTRACGQRVKRRWQGGTAQGEGLTQQATYNTHTNT